MCVIVPVGRLRLTILGRRMYVSFHTEAQWLLKISCVLTKMHVYVFVRVSILVSWRIPSVILRRSVPLTPGAVFFFNMLYLQRFGSMYFIRHLPFWFWLPWRRLPIVYTFNSWIAYVWVLDIAQIIRIARFVVFIESIVTNLWLTPMCGYLSVFCRVFQ